MKTEQLIRTLAQDLPTRPATAKASFQRIMPVMAILLTIGWLLAVGVRPDVLSTGLGPTLLKLGLGSILTWVGCYGALLLTRPDAPVALPARWLVAVPIFALVAAGAEYFSLGSQDWQARWLGKGQMVCLFVIPLLAVLPMWGMLFAMRRGAPTNPGAAGAFAGIGAAGIAVIAYGLFCTENSALFVGSWYLLAGSITALLGALAGRIALRW